MANDDLVIKDGAVIDGLQTPRFKGRVGKAAIAATVLSVVALSFLGTAPGSAGESTKSAKAVGEGVTATTIRLGITYVDFSAIQNVVPLNYGNATDAYLALIDNVNAHGGIDGRKIVPYIAPVNPIGPVGAAEACTQLTEDHTVFAVLGFFNLTDPACYLDTHGVPIVGGPSTGASLTTAQQEQAKATWFTNALSNNHAIPKEIDAFAQEHVFSGQKVGVVALAQDQPNVDLTLPELKKQHVDVVQTAINDVPVSDTPALEQEDDLIAAKFQSAGVTVVVLVGGIALSWAKSLQLEHSTYLPRMVSTAIGMLQAYVTPGYDPAILKGAIGGAPALADTAGQSAPVWNSPSMQRCVAVIRAAYPHDAMADPLTATPSAPTTWVDPEAACRQVTLFVDIAKAAGRDLNNETFLKAGESLSNVTLPGSAVPLHFGPGHHDGDGPVFIYTWNAAKKAFVVQAPK
jgi:hypothetical protein